MGAKRGIALKGGPDSWLWFRVLGISTSRAVSGWLREAEFQFMTLKFSIISILPLYLSCDQCECPLTVH